MTTINFRGMKHPDQRVMAWLGENGIDPARVPAEQDMDLNGKQLTYTRFVLSEEGLKVPVHGPDGDVCAWQKEQHTVTLTSTPDAFGLFELGA
jgi:hypothetical protein